MFEFRCIIKYGLIEQNMMRGYRMTEYQDIHSRKPRVPYLERISDDKYTCKTECLILCFFFYLILPLLIREIRNSIHVFINFPYILFKYLFLMQVQCNSIWNIFTVLSNYEWFKFIETIQYHCVYLYILIVC